MCYFLHTAELNGHNSHTYKLSLPLPSILPPTSSMLLCLHILPMYLPILLCLNLSCSLPISISYVVCIFLLAFVNLSLSHSLFISLSLSQLPPYSFSLSLSQRERDFFFCFFILIIQMSFVQLSTGQWGLIPSEHQNHYTQ